MAIDYQQILMDMNRPHRRQGKSMKTILALFLLMAVIFGGTFAAWHYGLVQQAWEGANGLVAKVIGREDGGEAVEASVAVASPGEQTETARPQAQSVAPLPVPQQTSSLRPASQPVRPLQAPGSSAPDGPVDIAREGSAVPRLVIPDGAMAQASVSSPASSPVSPVAAPAAAVRTAPSFADQQPLPQASAAQAQAQLQAQGMQQARQRPTQPAEQRQVIRPEQSAAVSPAGPDMAPVPVLSDAKAQIRYVDQILNSDPSEALRRLNDLQGVTMEPAEAAEVGYRKGYAARLLRDESAAESAWRETADKYPTLRGGRFSALALGDTWFQRYAGDRAQVSYWDDISLMYSRVLGMDDAPFLPEQNKAEVKKRINRINDSVFFGSAPSKLARYHKVESGELLGSIAGKYRVDYESIARINGINPNRIRPGMDLKLIVGDVSVVVRKNEQDPSRQPTLTWFLDGRWIREYPCCVGDGMKTPAGTYTFTSKERDPSWTNPVNGQLLPNDHPENILGSRWMAMKGMNTQGLGIHGTTVDDSIPGYTSAGCVRLLNKDVEELFSFGRIGGKVTILD